MKTAWLYVGLAVCVFGAAGCKRKAPAPEPTSEIPPAALEHPGARLEPREEPKPIGEHLTAQALTEDLVLYTLQIEFETDQAVIQPDYFADLDKIGKALTGDPRATARIEGHADKRNTSTPDHNQQLSKRRAAAVAEYLQAKAGIVPARLTPQGFGYDRPLEPNDPVNGNVRNRRVEIYISQGADTPPPAPAVAPAPEADSTPEDAGTPAP